MLSSLTTGEVLTAIGIAVAIVWNVWQFKYNSRKDSSLEIKEILKRIDDICDDVSAQQRKTDVLESKVGLFWKLVEDNLGDALARANPINLTTEEQIAANAYKVHRHKTPTPFLKMLDAAITREVPNMTHDERAVFTMLQGAIRSQLLDRREFSPTP